MLVFVLHQCGGLAAIILAHEEIDVQSGTIPTPGSVPQTQPFITPAGSLLSYHRSSLGKLGQLSLCGQQRTFINIQANEPASCLQRVNARSTSTTERIHHQAALSTIVPDQLGVTVYVLPFLIMLLAALGEDHHRTPIRVDLAASYLSRIHPRVMQHWHSEHAYIGQHVHVQHHGKHAAILQLGLCYSGKTAPKLDLCRRLGQDHVHGSITNEADLLPDVVILQHKLVAY